MSHDEFETLLQFFKVLGDESRLKIVGLLAVEEHSVGELAAQLEIKEPTVSHHLARLKEMNLVDVRAEGNNRIYFLKPKTLETMSKKILTPQRMATLAGDFSGEAWEQKVLRSFLDGEHLKGIPAQLKKRLVILRWLAEKFEIGRHYTEKEVNEILAAHHPDYASLRRYLISHNFMARESGIYWRLPDA